MYCSSMWFDSTVTLMKKKITFNNGLMRFLNLPKYNNSFEMFINLNILSFCELLRKSSLSFIARIVNPANLLVHGIVNSAVPLFNRNMSLVE